MPVLRETGGLAGLWLVGRKTGTFQEADLAAGLKTKGPQLWLQKFHL